MLVVGERELGGGKIISSTRVHIHAHRVRSAVQCSGAAAEASARGAGRHARRDSGGASVRKSRRGCPSGMKARKDGCGGIHLFQALHGRD